MNLFGGNCNNCGHGTNDCGCQLIWLLFLMQMCGCDNNMFCGNDCTNLLFLIMLLSCCGCGCGNTPCGNN